MTNPLYHAYLTIEQFAAGSKGMAALHRWWSLVFTTIFVGVRSVVAPPMAVWYWRRIMACADVPLRYRVLWAMTGVAIAVASQIFVRQFVADTLALWRAAKRPAAARSGPRSGRRASEAASSARKLPAAAVHRLADSATEEY